MGIRSSLRNAKYEIRYALYGACGPLLQKFYEGGFRTIDNGTLDNLLGEKSQLPDIAATAGALWASYKAGKAIDGRWPKVLRGSVQTLAYAGLIAAVFSAGAYFNSHTNAQPNEKSLDYVTTFVDNLREITNHFSRGEMAPLMYTILYGGLITGAARWAKNFGSSVTRIFAGKPGPSDDYKK